MTSARRRRVADVAWPLALLVVALVLFRRPPPPADSGGAVDCESPHAVDTATLERCLTFEPHHIAVITELGDRYAQAGDSPHAEMMYRRALALDPHDGEIHLRLGDLLLTRGDAGPARGEAEAALAALPGSRAAEALMERSRQSTVDSRQSVDSRRSVDGRYPADSRSER